MSPQDPTPVIVWITDEEAPPTYSVPVSVWKTDDKTLSLNSSSSLSVSETADPGSDAVLSGRQR